MGNPFPGMNPYLEQPELWHQVHNRLIVAMSDDKLLLYETLCVACFSVGVRIYADDLTPQIAPKYRVSIEEQVYTSVDDIFLVGIADVTVAKRNITDTSTTLTAAKLAEPSNASEIFVQIATALDATFTNCRQPK